MIYSFNFTRDVSDNFHDITVYRLIYCFVLVLLFLSVFTVFIVSLTMYIELC